jgi:uncharacterized protein
MTPYTTSKYPVAGYTHQWRIDGPPEVHYMLVCPGPIAREDAGVRYQDSAAELPAAAKLPGAGAKIKGLCAEQLAKKIIKGCERRIPEIIEPKKARVLFIVQTIAPRIGDWMIRRFTRDS